MTEYHSFLHIYYCMCVQLEISSGMMFDFSAWEIQSFKPYLKRVNGQNRNWFDVLKWALVRLNSKITELDQIAVGRQEQSSPHHNDPTGSFWTLYPFLSRDVIETLSVAKRYVKIEKQLKMMFLAKRLKVVLKSRVKLMSTKIKRGIMFS